MPSFPGEECTCDMDGKTIQRSTIVYRLRGMVKKLGKLKKGWQGSKAWCWVGPVLCSFIMPDWLDRNFFSGSLSNVSRNVFVLCRLMVEKSEQKDRKMDFITIPCSDVNTSVFYQSRFTCNIKFNKCTHINIIQAIPQ